MHIFVGPELSAQEQFDVPWIGYDTAVYPEGLWPYSSEMADFDGDGNTDLASVSWGGSAWLSILFSDGQGHFLPPVLHPLQSESQDLVARDFDNDGDVDIAIAESGRFWEGIFVSLWSNNGQGEFNLAGYFLTGDDGPSGITAADFNQDGWMDVAVAHDDYITRDNSIAVMFNNQSGGFDTGVVYQIATGTNDLHSGDLDGDGDADIVVAHETNIWTRLRNDNGRFQNLGTTDGITVGSIPEDPTIHIADVDLDGDADVMFSNIDSGGFGFGAIGLWRNDGSGNFGASETISLLTDLDDFVSGGTSINVADVTQDEWPDLLVCNGYWYLIEGDGFGGFLEPRLFHAGDGSIDSDVADMNGDGVPDVVITAYGSISACVYQNPGLGSFVQPTPIPMADPQLAPAFPTRLRVDDIDEDGDLDLVTAYRSDFSEQHGITVRKNNGDGTFGPIEEYLESTYVLDLQLADVDADGHEDLVYVLSNSRFYLRMNDGSGNFGPSLGKHTFSGVITQLEIEDIDNDGKLDIVVDGLGVSRNLGNLNFEPPNYTGCGAFFEFFDLADFDNDGILDLLSSSGAQSYPAFSFGDGLGNFGDCFTIPTGRDASGFDTADLDGDGNLDFVSYFNLDEKGLAVRRGRGDGNFFPGEKYPGAYYLGDHTSTVDLADFNEDGILDAITSSFGGQDFSYWQGLGNGSFLQDVRYGVGWNAFDIEPGDYNGDGTLDVAVICRVDSGRWWYPGVVIVQGIAKFDLILGDINRDGQVNLLDVQPIVDLLATGQFQAEADINQDGQVNLLDVAGFVELLGG